MTQDSLRAVLDSVFAGPDYRWVEREPALGTLGRWFDQLRGWLAGLRETHPLGFRLLLAGLVTVLILILVHAGYVLFRTLRGGSAVPGPVGEPPLRRDRAWYQREAARLAAEGRYVEAMQAEFLALILALDGSGVLRFHPGKTPAEYTLEPRLAPPAREELRELVRTLYGYAFARWPCGSAEFASWRARASPERYARAH